MLFKKDYKALAELYNDLQDYCEKLEREILGYKKEQAEAISKFAELEKQKLKMYSTLKLENEQLKHCNENQSETILGLVKDRRDLMKKNTRLECRLKHLNQSIFIRNYDEVDTKSGKYIRNIEDADMEIAELVSKIEQLKEAAATTALFECDREACNICTYPNCKLTKNIEHAKNFRRDGAFWYSEKIPKPLKVIGVRKKH